MRRISTFFYQLAQGFLGVFRNGVMSTASALVLVSCMLMLGTFYIVIDNMEYNMKSTADINLMTVNLPNNLDESDIARIKGEIEKIGEDTGTIKELTFTSKEENLKNFLEQLIDSGEISPDLLDRINETNNPIPASFGIRFTPFTEEDFDIDKIYSLKNRIASIEGLAADSVREKIDIYDNVTGINDILIKVGLWLMGILLAVSLFVIMNTIRLGMHARRHEITFMRYVGATKNFIRTPFIIEGMIIGLVSAAVAAVLQYYVHNYILADIIMRNMSGTDAAASVILKPFGEYIRLMLLAYGGIGLFAGIVASSISIKKYLKV